MLLCVDIGNTNIVLACYNGDAPVFQSRIATDRLRTGDQYAVELLGVLRLHAVPDGGIRGAVISSVVPALTEAMARAVESTAGVSPMIIGSDTATGLTVKLERPAELGSDLAAAAVAAKARYPLPCVIVDMGTATTITVLDAGGAFLGGAIVPGLRVSMDSLISKTSMLVGIALDAPANVIGRNTVDCMKSGSVIGSAAMLDGLIARMGRELGADPYVVATGGLAATVVPHCEHAVTIDDNLLMDGVRMIYEMNRPSGRQEG